MKKDKKTVSREIGVEIAAICGKYFLKLDHLHYGYWTDGLEVDIANVHIAQENYADFGLLPEFWSNSCEIRAGDFGVV